MRIKVYPMVLILNPANEQAIADIPFTTEHEAERAVQKAHRAFQDWRAVSPGEKARLLGAFADVVRTHAAELADLEMANAGHTRANAEWEAANVATVLDYYAGGPERLIGKQIPVPGGVDVTFHEPIGVVGIIVPWNFPMSIATWGFAPAIAAGCTVVLKPAETTPLTAMKLAEYALEAGLPEGVLTVLPGEGPVIGQHFVDNPLVRKVVFTGSTAVGKKVMAGCAAQVKRVTLELGGKSANIIFADSDLERAAATAPYGIFDNAGQDCCARSRILVQRSVYDDFMSMFEPAVLGVKVGDPTAAETEMGPLISRLQHDRVSSFMDDDVDVVIQSNCPSGPGFWFPPTVLRVTEHDRAYRDEIFGPIVTVVQFDDEDDAIRMANDSEYGLSGSIWTNDIGRAFRVARALESGNLSVNSHSSVRYWTPFGGFKQSGLGRELGPDALESFTETKNVFINTNP